MRISDWSSDVCSSDLTRATGEKQGIPRHRPIPGIVPERGGGRPADRRASADRRYHQLADRLARRHPRDRLAALRQRKGLGDARRDPALAPQIEQVRGMALVGRRIARGERPPERSEDHTSEPPSLLRTPYAVFFQKKTNHS